MLVAAYRAYMDVGKKNNDLFMSVDD
jgi:hypothetical protein